jgi:lipid A 3-O-deacylase
MRHYSLAILLIFVSSGTLVHGFELSIPGGSSDLLALIESEEGPSSEIKPPTASLDKFISFAWENDLYFQRDYYYTNGFQIEFFHDKLKRSPINRILIPFRNTRKGITWSGLQLRQEIFTPKDLAVDSISTGDHPYSSTLTIAQLCVFVLPDKHLRVVSGLRVGLLGPASLGFKTQELAHLVSNPSRPPQGWDYQVRNDLILNYDLQIEKGFRPQKSTLFGVKGKGRLGTLHTDLEAGLWFRFDARNGYFQRLGPMGGPGLNVVFGLSASASYVFYDATLQGGVINRSSPYIVAPDQMIRFLGNLEGKLTFELYQHQLECYTQISTPRFQMAKPHGWMGIAYKYWF